MAGVYSPKRGHKGRKKGVRQEDDRLVRKTFPRVKCSCEEFQDSLKRCAHCVMRYHRDDVIARCPKSGHYVHSECIVLLEHD